MYKKDTYLENCLWSDPCITNRVVQYMALRMMHKLASKSLYK